MHYSLYLVVLSAASFLQPVSAGSSHSTPTSPACEKLLKAHSLASVKPTLKKNEVIPDILSQDFEPSVLLEVVYANKTDVVLGDNIPLADTVNEPQVIACPVGKHKPHKTYTLIMADPDAPSRATPTYRNVRHWVATGVRLPSSKAHSPYIIQPNQPVAPYLNPQPPAGSGQHRYVFVLLEEPSPNFSIPAAAPEYNATIPGRLNWDVTKFEKKYNLHPVGAAFFETGAD